MRLVLHKLQDDDLNVGVAGIDSRRILVYFFQSFLNLITIINTNMVLDYIFVLNSHLKTFSFCCFLICHVI